MTDIKSTKKSNRTEPDEPLDGESLRQAIEMLFFAYRDFTSGPDEILKEYGFGRAHHRAIYFVGRHPNRTVSDLLSILRITKQSLNRVLSQLVREGFIAQRPGEHDKRQRLLSLTEKGKMLEARLTANQQKLIAGAYGSAGLESVDGFRRVLLGVMSNEEDRRRFE